MPVCCVIGCQSGSPAYSHEKVQQFPFPKAGEAPQLRKLWIEQIGRQEGDGTMWLPRKDSSVCRKHFKDKDFVTDNVDAKGRTRKRLQLKPRARPTQYLRTPPPQISNTQLKKMEDQIRPGPSGEHNYPINEGKFRHFGQPGIFFKSKDKLFSKTTP